MWRAVRVGVLFVVALAAVGQVGLPRGAQAAPAAVFFPVTGQHVEEPFLGVWRAQGGLPIFGYPLTERVERDGMLVQYFERARFELHPEYAGTEYETLLTLLGSAAVAGRTEAAFQRFPVDTPRPAEANRTFFPETGHYLSYGFKAYWERYGGLRVFGYPLSEELSEGGRTVQYFERARFEWHPEHRGTRYEVLLGRLGADAAQRDGVSTAPVPRRPGVPDYAPELFARSFDLPVLMYHQFGEPASQYRIPYWRFEQQLDWLQANGYTTVTMTQVYDALEGRGVLPARPVMLTFDDGFVSQWGAVQALNARGMVGVFFITTGQPHLAPWQLRQMTAWGHEIGAHTITHPDLTQVSDERLWRELAETRDYLRAASGGPVDFFAYPYGAYDGRVIAAVQAVGYRGAVAAWGGRGWTPEKRWVQPRIEIAGYLSLEQFAGYVR
jgi:peptidoglycan/xylan/chitin deacetylase (PgdA/CDA1 family)